jgi:hypothetical protein
VDGCEGSCWAASRCHCHEREIEDGGQVGEDRCTVAGDAPSYSGVNKGAWLRTGVVGCDKVECCA